MEIELSNEELGMIIAALVREIYELRQKGDTQLADKLVLIKDHLKRYHKEPHIL